MEVGWQMKKKSEKEKKFSVKAENELRILHSQEEMRLCSLMWEIDC